MLRFVINLDRSPDRWLSINKQLTKLGINAERISAFDGNTLTHDEIKKLTPKLYSKWEFPREIIIRRNRMLFITSRMLEKTR